MLKRMGTRQRVILASLLISLFAFLLISPLIKVGFETLFAPAEVSNIIISKTSVGEISISWSRGEEYDLKGYRIFKDSEFQDVDANVDKYVVTGLDQLRNYTFGIASLDLSGNISTTTQFRYSDVDGILNLNQVIEQPFAITLIIRSLIFGFLVFLLTAWVLFYKFSRKNILNIVLIPTLTLIPYLLLSITTIETINTLSNKFIGSMGLSLMFIVVGYISFLTTNILNASLTIKLPLEQAAKATHFILSLLSTYLVLIYAFGSYQNIIFRIIVLIPFVYVYTYAGLTINKNSYKVASIKSMGITLTVLLSAFVASVWPVEVAYSILMIAVVYYILLNLALEVRTRYTNALWVEYSSLLILVVLLFFTTSTWGINFSII